MSRSSAPPIAPTALTREHWQPLAQAHHDRIDALTAGHRQRAAAGQAHAAEDFLFRYYNHKAGLLRRWHPGPDLALTDAAGEPIASWQYYRTDQEAVSLDLAAFLAARSRTVSFVRDLLAQTAGREPNLGCFAIHEWAMAYRIDPAKQRHPLPLRLGSSGTDAVVEGARIRCSHADAYRFFTPEAIELNELRPARDTQAEFEQPGCLHANMDLYKWAFKLAPAMPSSITADAFELALRARTLDMRASPYDCTSLGYEPIEIETANGKAEFITEQRAVMNSAQMLRERMITLCDQLLAAAEPAGDSTSA